ncbi:hypothetical protein EHW97_05235 [Aeromicrobium camelliae]|uniref:PH domain-containing protein n=1 Tax=Aeromicrobium camelliae TaxID=1538144 RepID=A0A3N6ZNM0_9ACTN|nr:hypothetical protein [Aeromicrobium camelliae]RQN08657.1 hypothetical protein EHW97_05235 [Aeromicrobium camelliae]
MRELTMAVDKQRSLRRLNFSISFALTGLFVVLGLMQLLIGSPAGVIYLAAAPLMVALTLVLVKRQEAQSRVIFGDGSYEAAGMFRRQRFEVDAVERVITVNSMPFGALAPTHHLIVLGATKRLLLLVGYMWTVEQLTELANDLTSRGVPLTAIRVPITPAQLQSLDSRTLEWWRAHPVLFAILLSVLVVIVVVGAGIVIVAGFVLAT